MIIPNIWENKKCSKPSTRPIQSDMTQKVNIATNSKQASACGGCAGAADWEASSWNQQSSSKRARSKRASTKVDKKSAPWVSLMQLQPAAMKEPIQSDMTQKANIDNSKQASACGGCAGVDASPAAAASSWNEQSIIQKSKIQKSKDKSWPKNQHLGFLWSLQQCEKEI